MKIRPTSTFSLEDDDLKMSPERIREAKAQCEKHRAIRLHTGNSLDVMTFNPYNCLEDALADLEELRKEIGYLRGLVDKDCVTFPDNCQGVGVR